MRMSRRFSSSSRASAVTTQLRALSRLAATAALGYAAHGCSDPDYAAAPLSCENGDRHVLFNLKLARDVDFVGLYIAWAYALPLPERRPSVSTSGEWGEACRSALASEECLQRVETAQEPSEACLKDDKGCGPFVVTTVGDEVHILSERSELIALLGQIDTASEAMAVCEWDRDPIRCPDPSQKLAGTRADPLDDGWRVQTEWENCGVAIERFTVKVGTNGETSERSTVSLGTSNCVIGRRPVGLHAADLRFSAGSLGAYFAHAAHLEAASVVAFERLARELSALGAPEQLIAAAARSALDEVRHASAVTQLAQPFGAARLPLRVDALAARSRFEIALENAVEGCVRETYGAVVGQYQAARALDRAVRDVMRVIAVDELRHAELAWEVAAWLEPQLSDAEQGQLMAAKRSALFELQLSAARAMLPAQAERLIGLPPCALASQLVMSLGKLVLTA